MLVKCDGKPGDKFIVATGANLSPFGRAGFSNETTASSPVEQPVVMTIELAAAGVGRGQGVWSVLGLHN